MALSHPFITGEKEVVSNNVSYIVSPGSNIGFRTPHVNYINDNKTVGVVKVTPETTMESLHRVEDVVDTVHLAKEDNRENMNTLEIPENKTQNGDNQVRYKLLEFIGDETIIDENEKVDAAPGVKNQKRKRLFSDEISKDGQSIAQVEGTEGCRRVSARLRTKK